MFKDLLNVRIISKTRNIRENKTAIDVYFEYKRYIKQLAKDKYNIEP